MHVKDIAKFLEQDAKELIRQGYFDKGLLFRPNQKEAQEAFDLRLHDPDIPYVKAVTGFFDICAESEKNSFLVGVISNA